MGWILYILMIALRTGLSEIIGGVFGVAGLLVCLCKYLLFLSFFEFQKI